MKVNKREYSKTSKKLKIYYKKTPPLRGVICFTSLV